MQLQTADFDHRDFQVNDTREADKALLVKFYVKPRLDQSASRIEGRPIYRDVEYIDIRIPGDRNGGVGRPATEADKQRFSEHYRRFKDRTSDDMVTGTPLSEWPVISRSLCEELAFFHVKTVEQLATMADTQVSKFRGLYNMREKARTWLKNVESEKPIWELEQKNEALNKQVAELEKTVRDLVQIVEGADDPEDDELNDRQKERKRKRTVEAARVSAGK